MALRAAKGFLVGGVIGVIGQILISLAGLFIEDPTMAMMVGIALFGVVGVIMIVTGVYFKVVKFGGDAAAIPVCGLMFGAATGAAAARKDGASKGKAFLVGFTNVIKVLGTGYVLAFLLGLLLK